MATIAALKINDNEYAVKSFSNDMVALVDFEELNLSNYVEFRNYLKRTELVKKYETEDDLLSYVLILTTECNLACSYCYERNIKNKTTIQNTELLVEHIINDIEISGIRRVEVEFTGGEPLLNIDKIKKIVEELSALSIVDFKFSIVTNGLLINKDILDFLEYYKFNVQISLDGYSRDHNLLRVDKDKNPTFDIIIKNIIMLLNYTKSVMLSLRINLSALNHEKIHNVVYELNEKIPSNLRKDIFVYCDYVDVENDNENFLKDDIIYNKILYLYFLLEKYSYRIPENYISAGLCMIKNDNSIAFDPDGNIIKCYSCVGDNNVKIGEVSSSECCHYPYKPILALCDDINCPVQFYCSGGCAYKEYIKNNKLDIHCEMRRIMLFNKALFILTLVSERIVEIENFEGFKEAISNVEIFLFD